MKRIVFFFIGVLGLVIACSLEQEVTVFSVTYDFTNEDFGWTGDFAEYPEGDSVFYELFYKHDTLPANLNSNATRKALHLEGNNHSDDLFMFVKKKVSGLAPNTTYVVLFNVKIASNAPTGAVGVGGAPGESVYVKAGATKEEPKKVLTDGMYRMNIDKGNQATAGADMMVIGNIGVAATTTQFTYISRNNNSSTGFIAETNDSGELWLIVGTDSGFEGKTILYYSQIDILFNRLD